MTKHGGKRSGAGRKKSVRLQEDNFARIAQRTNAEQKFVELIDIAYEVAKDKGRTRELREALTYVLDRSAAKDSGLAEGLRVTVEIIGRSQHKAPAKTG